MEPVDVSVCQQILKALGIRLNSISLQKAVKEHAALCECLMTLNFEPCESAYIKLWDIVKNTAARDIWLAECLKLGTKWCYTKLDLSDSERIQLMATVLGAKSED